MAKVDQGRIYRIGQFYSYSQSLPKFNSIYLMNNHKQKGGHLSHGNHAYVAPETTKDWESVSVSLKLRKSGKVLEIPCTKSIGTAYLMDCRNK